VRCSREKVGGKIRGLPQDRQGAKAKTWRAREADPHSRRTSRRCMKAFPGRRRSCFVAGQRRAGAGVKRPRLTARIATSCSRPAQPVHRSAANRRRRSIGRTFVRPLRIWATFLNPALGSATLPAFRQRDATVTRWTPERAHRPINSHRASGRCPALENGVPDEIVVSAEWPVGGPGAPSAGVRVSAHLAPISKSEPRVRRVSSEILARIASTGTFCSSNVMMDPTT